jgi:hypothetical protein
MTKAVYDTANRGYVNRAVLADTATVANSAPWSGITGAPASYPPSAHASTHNLGGSDAIAPDWTQVQNKPGQFSPLAHESTHITGGSDIIPAATSTKSGLLNPISGNTTDFVDGTNSCQNLVTAIQPTIWSVRLRSFQALGNNTFEVDQRNVGTTLTNVGDGTFIQDRWQNHKAGTMQISAGQQSVAAGINWPGTNFAITRSFLRVTLTTAESSLAAGDVLYISQSLEGPRWRELQNDVHSLQVLVRSSVAGLSVGASLRDPTTAHSLTSLLTIPGANTWTLLPLANLPAWPAGTFVNTPGNVGYLLGITLAAGSTYTSPANGIWQNGNFLGAPGQSNFAASPVNSTFDLAFVQHEPGALCSTPMDCPFTENLNACERYFLKNQPYGTLPNATTGNNLLGMISASNLTFVLPSIVFPKRLAKAAPTLIIYDANNGTANSVYNSSTAVHATVSTAPSTETAIQYINLTTAQAAGNLINFNYIADTGW